MAFFIIKTRSGYYANAELVAVAEKTSHWKVAIVPENRFAGLPAVKITEDSALFNFPDVAVQDLDTQLLGLASISEETKVVKVSAKTNKEVFHYEGYDLIKMKDLYFHNKYAYVRKMATVKIFGTLFVVFDRQGKRSVNTKIAVVRE